MGNFGSDWSNEFLEDAKQLTRLPREDQKRIIAELLLTATNPNVPQQERELARERAEALENHLRRLRKTKRFGRGK